MSAEEKSNIPEGAAKPEDPPELVSDDTELDALLDNALEDFNAPRPKPRSSDGNIGGGKEPEQGSQWTEEFIKQATTQFEQNMRLLLGKAEDKGAGPPTNVSELEETLKKHAEAAAKSALQGMPERDVPSVLAENLKSLTDNMSQFQQSTLSEEDMSKMLGNMAVGGDEEDSGGELGEFMPFMQVMMQSLLSKDLLYPAVQDVVAKYPGWLEENKGKVDPVQFGKYERQLEMMKQLCQEFEQEKPSDSEETKEKRFERILEMLNKMQEYGHPPKEIVGDAGPLSLPADFGIPKIPGLPTDQCSLM